MLFILAVRCEREQSKSVAWVCTCLVGPGMVTYPPVGLTKGVTGLVALCERNQCLIPANLP